MYFPEDSTWRRQTCTRLGLSCKDVQVNNPNSEEMTSLNTERPNVTHNVPGDGNCFFSAVSFIISGNERYHRIIRKAVCDHLCSNQNELKTYLPPRFHGNVREYLRQTNMRNAGVWATEVEIFTVHIC